MDEFMYSRPRISRAESRYSRSSSSSSSLPSLSLPTIWDSSPSAYLTRSPKSLKLTPTGSLFVSLPRTFPSPTSLSLSHLSLKHARAMLICSLAFRLLSKPLSYATSYTSYTSYVLCFPLPTRDHLKNRLFIWT